MLKGSFTGFVAKLDEALFKVRGSSPDISRNKGRLIRIRNGKKLQNSFEEVDVQSTILGFNNFNLFP